MIEYKKLPIPGYEDFTIDTCGVVTEIRTGKVVKHWHTKKAIVKAKVFDSDGKGKRIQVSLYVAKLFIPNPNNYKHVWYKDGNRTNVNAYNIFWAKEDLSRF